MGNKDNLFLPDDSLQAILDLKICENLLLESFSCHLCCSSSVRSVHADGLRSHQHQQRQQEIEQQQQQDEQDRLEKYQKVQHARIEAARRKEPFKVVIPLEADVKHHYEIHRDKSNSRVYRAPGEEVEVDNIGGSSAASTDSSMLSSLSSSHTTPIAKPPRQNRNSRSSQSYDAPFTPETVKNETREDKMDNNEFSQTNATDGWDFGNTDYQEIPSVSVSSSGRLKPGKSTSLWPPRSLDLVPNQSSLWSQPGRPTVDDTLYASVDKKARKTENLSDMAEIDSDAIYPMYKGSPTRETDIGVDHLPLPGGLG